MKAYDLPFLSQHQLPDPWKLRGCGITAMKIILDYWNQIDQENQTETIERLIDRAVASGAYLEGIGWAQLDQSTAQWFLSDFPGQFDSSNQE
jgi:hypothetical protein